MNDRIVIAVHGEGRPDTDRTGGAIAWGWYDTSKRHTVGGRTGGTAEHGTDIGELTAVLQAIRAHRTEESVCLLTSSDRTVHLCDARNRNGPAWCRELLRAIRKECGRRRGRIAVVRDDGSHGELMDALAGIIRTRYVRQVHGLVKDKMPKPALDDIGRCGGSGHGPVRRGPLRIDVTGASMDGRHGHTDMAWAWSVDGDASSRRFGATGKGYRRGSNLMHMAAVLDALRAHPKGALDIRTDSDYVHNSMTKWLRMWRRSDWCSYTTGTTIRNVHTIRAIDDALSSHDGPVSFTLVDGDDGMHRNLREWCERRLDARLRDGSVDWQGHSLASEVSEDLAEHLPAPGKKHVGKHRDGSGDYQPVKRARGPRTDVWTDGSALSSRGPMGWAWHDAAGHEACGGARLGTNNMGELTAVLQAVRSHPGDGMLVVHSDSKYAIGCSSTWARKWKRDHWRRGSNPISNLVLVKAISEAIESHAGPVSFEWVKGHNADRGNERCDQLANGYARAIAAGDGPDKVPPETVENTRNELG